MRVIWSYGICQYTKGNTWWDEATVCRQMTQFIQFQQTVALYYEWACAIPSLPFLTHQTKSIDSWCVEPQFRHPKAIQKQHGIQKQSIMQSKNNMVSDQDYTVVYYPGLLNRWNHHSSLVQRSLKMVVRHNRKFCIQGWLDILKLGQTLVHFHTTDIWLEWLWQCVGGTACTACCGACNTYCTTSLVATSPAETLGHLHPHRDLGWTCKRWSWVWLLQIQLLSEDHEYSKLNWVFHHREATLWFLYLKSGPVDLCSAFGLCLMVICQTFCTYQIFIVF